jgi:hypothetical protein
MVSCAFFFLEVFTRPFVPVGDSGIGRWAPANGAAAVSFVYTTRYPHRSRHGIVG